jgi:hypothetical protein
MINPKKGYLTELRDYKDQYPDFTFQMNTFGFGYDLLSDVLLEIATEANGTFGFIPDGLIVGTNFVNSLANTLSTYSQACTLRLIPKGGATFAGPVMGELQESSESWGRHITLGPLQFGQAREICIPMKVPAGTAPYLEAVVSFGRGGKTHSASVVGNRRDCTQDAMLASLRS